MSSTTIASMGTDEATVVLDQREPFEKYQHTRRIAGGIDPDFEADHLPLKIDFAFNPNRIKTCELQTTPFFPPEMSLAFLLEGPDMTEEAINHMCSQKEGQFIALFGRTREANLFLTHRGWNVNKIFGADQYIFSLAVSGIHVRP